MYKTCTFFGHRDCPESIKPILWAVVEKLIIVHGVDMFYAGNQGRFDEYARQILRRLKEKYPDIRYTVVLAYMPTQNNTAVPEEETMFPEGIETIHPQYAVSWRNQWMLERADFVVTYVVHGWGGAARFEKLARTRKKTVINVADAISSSPVSDESVF